ncbi:3317_t:CDS:1 [Funneliformis geosporum]|uniref:20054_t:CDS:1 n=1 Tax=Funneliformis geosporum TaxID=1117311 RepID=A0A9W4SB60_9GLOM|nr:20054_t:CDS:1 [Funneliformis geosporum]CAI2162009.1 3317_t:CDS:1 [Funneliformis geosporum]
MTFENTHLINSQNGEFILHLSPQDIQLPYPPSFITVSDFINKRESSARIFRKSPNAFFIYRKAFTNYLTLLNFKLTMIDVSKLVSNRWKNESDEVKKGYRKIAKEIDVELKEKRKHDKVCPVVWKVDKKSKKQKRNSRKIPRNNSTSDSLTKVKSVNTKEITFEFQNCFIPENQKTLRSTDKVNVQSDFENSPNPVYYPLVEFPEMIQECNFGSHDHSCGSPSNESEEDYHPAFHLNTCLNPVYCSRMDPIENQINPQVLEYVNYDLHNHFLPQYNWNLNNLSGICVNENLSSLQESSEYHH